MRTEIKPWVLQYYTNWHFFYNYTAVLLCMYTEILLLLWNTIKKWTDYIILRRQKNFFIYLTLQFTLLLQAKIFWCISHCSEGLLWVMSRRRRSTKPNSKYLHMLETLMYPSTLSYSVQNSFIVCYELKYLNILCQTCLTETTQRSNGSKSHPFCLPTDFKDQSAKICFQ